MKKRTHCVPRKPRYKPTVEQEPHSRPQKCLDNLVRFSDMPAERHKELSAKGGKASAAARARERERIAAIKAEERARQELIHEEVCALKIAAKELLKAAARI